MYFCEKRELNCLKRLILQRIIYIILMDSNNLTPLRKGVVGVQFLFVAFGATVLVPLLVGLDPSTALFTAGIGTLIFHAVTRGKVPVFLGSSFAFIAPIIKATELYGLPGTLSGMVGVALVYFVMSALVKWQGVRVIGKMVEADVIVMATPVYFYTLSAQMKTLIDRCCARYLEMKGKEFYFILTAAEESVPMMERTVECFRGLLDCLEDPREKGVVYGVGAWRAGDIEGMPAMDEAYAMGRGV